MKITLLPSACSAHGVNPYQYATTYLVNDHIAIDAGSLGFYGSPAEQAGVRHVFLSHSHIDHLASLPIFLENVAGLSDGPVTLYASTEVERCLRSDVFNGRIWPNFLELTHAGRPFAVLRTISSGASVEADDVRITPVAVNHTVPTLGFIVEDATGAVVISSDTGPTDEIWMRAAQTPNLKGAFLELTFPDSHQDLADLTRHLTPGGFVREMQKLPRPIPFFAVHLKARFRAQVAADLLGHRLPNVEIAKFGTAYDF